MLMHLVLALVAGLVAADVAQAQSKVHMPKEGEYKVLWCIAASSTVPLATKELTFGQYTADANLVTEPAGHPFDRQSARCWGVFGNVMGKSQELAFCEVVDQDGDKWYPEAHGNAEGTGGTYTVPYGTGKYAGMTLRAEWRSDFWPVGSGNTLRLCNPNKGTYKLAR